MTDAAIMEQPPARNAPAVPGAFEYWVYVCLLSALGMLGSFSIDTYLPAFGAIAQDFHVKAEVVQQTLTIYLGTFAVAMLFYGTISDTYGRRRVILVALTGFIVGAAGAAFARSIGSLLVFRAMQGLFVGAGAVLGRAVVRDLYPGHEGERLMAHISAVFGIAPAVAPIIGGWLQAAFGWRSIFYFLTGISVAIFLACWRCLPETLPERDRTVFHPASILRQYGRVAGRGAFLFQCLAGGLIFTGISIYVSDAPDFVVNVLHLPATAFGWLFLPIIIGGTAGSMLAGRLAGRLPPGRLVRVALGVQGIAAVGNVLYVKLAPALTVPWAVLPIFIYTFGLSLASPGMALRAMDLFPAVRGLASSLLAFVQVMLFAVVSGCIAPLVYGSGMKVAIVLLIGWVGGVVCWWEGTRERSELHPRAAGV